MIKKKDKNIIIVYEEKGKNLVVYKNNEDSIDFSTYSNFNESSENYNECNGDYENKEVSKDNLFDQLCKNQNGTPI